MRNGETLFLVLFVLSILVFPFLWMAWQGANLNTENFIYKNEVKNHQTSASEYFASFDIIM